MKNFKLLMLSMLVMSIFLISIIPAAPTLEKMQFVHYNDGHVKVVGAQAQAAQSKQTVCYKLSGVKWRSVPVNYVINPLNSNGLSESFVTTAVFNAAEQWDKNTRVELFSNAYTVDYSAVYGVQNYRNEISFGNYPNAGVIAVTTIWWNPTNKNIVEFDIELDTDYVWGDAAANSSVMDLQNIATHELGHAVGLSDLYTSACSAETMYGYSNYGDIAKRTLNKGDIAGIKKIYG